MNKHSTLKSSGSLLERAAEVYDFSSAIRVPVLPERDKPRAKGPAAPIYVPPAPPASAEAADIGEAQSRKRRGKMPVLVHVPEEDEQLAPEGLYQPAEEPMLLEERAAEPSGAAADWYQPVPSGRYGEVDRKSLEETGFILPDSPVTGLAEEFRIIKGQLLQALAQRSGLPPEKRQSILVCSAQPDEGKTFSAVNLALSLAGEKDLEVLLVDGDFVKPEILSMLGLEGGPGLIDAIADPAVDAESFVIRTDLGGLSVLPAGRQENNVTELLASERTRDVLAGLVRRRPKRIVIFDSPPALMASPASVLATHVGQVLMVVRADQTTEADLKEAIGLLSGCDNVSLMLNGAGFAATGRRFGSYYGYGQ